MPVDPPFVCDPTDQSTGRQATFIFLHGYGDDAQGIPLGIAQQFQWYSKLPWLRWVLPNAPMHPEAGQQAWFTPRAFPSGLKPRVPGHDDDDDDDAAEADDETGIRAGVDAIDALVQAEVERGVEPSRIVVGGFSQGCAVSTIWGLTGHMRDKVGGVVCLAGYFPLADRIARIRRDRGLSEGSDASVAQVKWLLQHGTRDQLVPARYFQTSRQELGKWVADDNVTAKLYDGMGHSAAPPALRDMLLFLEAIVPA